MKYNLEQRLCKCGCGLTFKCLPTSTAQYAIKNHNPRYSVYTNTQSGMFNSSPNRFTKELEEVNNTDLNKQLGEE